jgi:oxygen-independent coproporphyrinogen-3 oxidase
MPPSLHNSLGLYISIPFCRSKCTYCNFASGVFPASDHAPYVDRLVAGLHAAPAWASSRQLHLPRQVDTIYFGGGTPVLLSPELFTRIFAAIRQVFRLSPGVEITVECAPGQLSDATLAAMAEAGVNRVSLGVQSFLDSEAAASGRLHTRAVVLEDLKRLRAAGIANLNIDLLAGLAGQTLASWRESLSVLLDTGIPHASIYMLEIDEDSRLGRELLSGGARYFAPAVPSDDLIADMYQQAVSVLAHAGLAQYEISNFARSHRAESFESRHNLRYWQRLPYLGLGLDASSMLQSSDYSRDPTILRATTTSDLAQYLSSSPGHAIHETSWLGPAQQLEEAWFLGLRRNSGVDVPSLLREFGPEAAEPSIAVAHRLAEEGLLEFTGLLASSFAGSLAGSPGAGRFRLTPRGRLISNDVFAEFLGLSSPDPARNLAEPVAAH